jgi:aminopeptidase YwaD
MLRPEAISSARERPCSFRREMIIKSRILPGLVALIAVIGVACSAVPTATSTPAPTSVPTLIPTPTSASVATATPNSESTAVTTESLDDTALEYLIELVEELGPRESATQQERAAAEFLESELTGLGYSVEAQPFTVERFSSEESGFFVEIGNSGGAERIEAFPLSGSGAGEVSGELVPVGLARPEDIPEAGLEGKIALVERGLITFGQKTRNARDAGAIGVVIYNNEVGNFRGVLGSSAEVPVVSISHLQGQRLEELASANGEVRATVLVKLVELPSQNVVAEKPGTGDKVVVLGAHYDTVPNVPGANDNASGTAVLLAITQELKQKFFPFTIRFIAFGSEELGLLGSQAYVEPLSAEEREQIIAMLNFDALGSGNSLIVLGNRDLASLAVELGASQGIDVELSPGLGGGSSDHASFAQVGIPVVMFTSDDPSLIHTPQDRLEFINPQLPGNAARLALGILDSLAETN